MKLNIDFDKVLTKEQEIRDRDREARERIDRYKNPVGWWDVSTSGDEEGKTVNNLGTHYGHIAEIAFHLANKSFYGLRFSPADRNGEGTRSQLDATGTLVDIGFNYYSTTSNMSANDRAVWFRAMLNITDKRIEVIPSNYYGSVTLKSVG